MRLRRGARALRIGAALAAACLIGGGLLAASTDVQARNRPGDFDFYVLALSWSPTHCLGEADDASSLQCGPKARPYAFVVHGLWPQYEHGWPQYCQKPAPFVAEPVVRSMLDLMPARGLVLHQWRKHGTCSGLDSATYFEKTRLARSRVTIPEPYRQIDAYLTVTPAQVEQDFVAANPGLAPDMVSVQCKDRNLSEVRICMSRTFQYTACPEVDADACKLDRIVMPPMRGG